MHNIGLDFGTTYSVISRLNDVTKNKAGRITDYSLEACQLSQRSTFEDSIVVKKSSGEYVIGSPSRSLIGRNGVTVYKGFKMLLPETNEDILSERGYTGTDTPRNICDLYISDLIDRYAKSFREDNVCIDKVVVGVPAIWFDDLPTVDARSVLQSIIASNPYVKPDGVELVSEPEAACAFFTENYRKNTGKKYKGKILIIDYGGGTLDIALCDVNDNGNTSEVTVIKRCGEGQNSKCDDKLVGVAGMAFIEGVVKCALEANGFNKEEIIKNRDFYACVETVEEALMNNGSAIEETFSLCRLNKKKLNEIKFTDISYKDVDYDITYGMLARTYDLVIKDVLKQSIDEIKKFMMKEGIKFFKIAPVGGFCNFFLTLFQIKSEFGIEAGDKRYSDIITDARDCEKAVSYGAALIANDIIKFVRVAPFTLRIVGAREDETGKTDEYGRPVIVPNMNDVYTIIQSGVPIDYDTPVYLKTADGMNDMIVTGEFIPFLSVKFDNGLSCCKRPANDIKLIKDHAFKIGFSFDKSLVLTLHTVDMGSNQDPNFDSTKPGIHEQRRLNDIKSIFGGIMELVKEDSI